MFYGIGIIGGRGACASWMHSIEEQERYEERQSMSSDVDDLRSEIQSQKDELAEKDEIITELKQELKKSKPIYFRINY